MNVTLECPVVSSRRTFLIGGIVATAATATPSGILRTYAAETQEPDVWTDVAPLPKPRSEFAATVLDGAIYVAGGYGAERGFLRFDPTAASWSELAELPSPRNHLGIAALDGYVYVAGGHASDNTATKTFWRYDPGSDAWEDLPDLPQGPCGALGCAALDGKIYTAGGSLHDLNGPATGNVAVYDPLTGEWALLASLTIRREHLVLGAASGRLFAIGGRDGGDMDSGKGSANEIYDPATDRWLMGAHLPSARSGMGIASDGDSVVVLGGEGREGNGGIYDRVQRYDPATDSWSDLTPLPIARHGVAAATLDDRLYAIGGSTQAFGVQNIFGVDMLPLPSLANK